MLFQMKKIVCAACMLVLVILVGCNRDGLVSVKGTVTFDGEAIQDGSIAFISDRGEGATYGGQFQNGSYSFRVPVGECLVRIYAFKAEDVKTPLGGGAGVRANTTKTVQFIPEKYNVRSSLFQEIPQKASTIDFHLKSDNER